MAQSKPTNNRRLAKERRKEEEAALYASEDSSESTSCMFSGKKRKRQQDSGRKQRYLKETSRNSHFEFYLASIPEKPKTKKQYWTADEVFSYPTHTSVG